jgi:hypothetical protein
VVELIDSDRTLKAETANQRSIMPATWSYTLAVILNPVI